MSQHQPTPSLLISKDFISVSLNGKAYTVYSADFRYNLALEAIKAKNYGSLENILNKSKAIETFSSGKITVKDDQVLYSGAALSNVVVGKILEFIKEGLPHLPLINFLDKLMSNPSKRSVEQLYSYIEKYKLPICEDGDFLGYKAVRPDFKDKHSGTIDNHLNANPKMRRNECEEDHNVACAASYHLGDIDYVKYFGQPDDEVVTVKVNPRDVVSCPIDFSYQKLRVCEYVVIAEIGKVKDLKPFESNVTDNQGKGIEKSILVSLDTFSEGNIGKETQEEIPTYTKIGANKAYLLFKQGRRIKRAKDNRYTILNHKEIYPRSYFRQFNDWYLVENNG